MYWFFFFSFKKVSPLDWLSWNWKLFISSIMGSSWHFCLVLLALSRLLGICSFFFFNLLFIDVFYGLTRDWGSVYKHNLEILLLALFFVVLYSSPAATFALKSFPLRQRSKSIYFLLQLFYTWPGMDWGLSKVKNRELHPVLSPPLQCLTGFHCFPRLLDSCGAGGLNTIFCPDFIGVTCEIVLIRVTWPWLEAKSLGSF